VRDLPRFDHPDLLVGADTLSDAGVYRITESLAIVQSVDFFAPVVDDPYVYGQIAAANALGDLYAMGALPRTCLNVVAFPDKELELELLSTILAGAAERVKAAGAVVVGGHSVRDAEIKFGLSVTGVVDPARMLTNAAARPGEALVLTKGLGTGVITTALRGDRCPDSALDVACESMVRLNADASSLAVELGATAATDITGFGLLGHAREMADASGVTIEIDALSLPVLPGALELASVENRSSASRANREFLDGRASVPAGLAEPIAELLFDPQTSGGLLIAIDQRRAQALADRCREAGDGLAAVVGRVADRGDNAVSVRA